MSVEARLWAKVYKSSSCWLWLGGQTTGYGVIGISGNSTKYAHRVAWELKHGPIPKGIVACHKCDVRNCVNPDHLFLGTHDVNMADMVRKDRANGPLGAEAAFPKLTEDEWIEYANRLIDHRTPNPISRFWSKVDKSGDCWLWTGTIVAGYGKFALKGRDRAVHRHAWKLTHGPIPDGLCVCHKCDVRTCVNPDHLFLGTHQDNMTDMARKQRTRPLRGEQSPRAKLNDEMVCEMRARFAAGETSMIELGRCFGVSHDAARKVVSHRTWRHLP